MNYSGLREVFCAGRVRVFLHSGLVLGANVQAGVLHVCAGPVIVAVRMRGVE
jgi:hypothetical protein